MVGEDLSVTYLGKAGGIVPELTKIEKEIRGEREAIIKVEAKTKDEEGLGKLILLKNGIKVEEKEVSGKQVAEDFIISNNGTYRVKAIANNKKQAQSSEVIVTEMIITTGTIEAGTVLNAEALLTIRAETKEEGIKKIELYVGGEKQEEKVYETMDKQKEQELMVSNMPFYEDILCYANITDSRGTIIKTNEITIKNTNAIVAENDFLKFATMVNGGNTFSGKSLKIINNIALSGQWTP